MPNVLSVARVKNWFIQAATLSFDEVCDILDGRVKTKDVDSRATAMAEANDKLAFGRVDHHRDFVMPFLLALHFCEEIEDKVQYLKDRDDIPLSADDVPDYLKNAYPLYRKTVLSYVAPFGRWIDSGAHIDDVMSLSARCMRQGASAALILGKRNKRGTGPRRDFMEAALKPHGSERFQKMIKKNVWGVRVQVERKPPKKKDKKRDRNNPDELPALTVEQIIKAIQMFANSEDGENNAIAVRDAANKHLAVIRRERTKKAS